MFRAISGRALNVLDLNGSLISCYKLTMDVVLLFDLPRMKTAMPPAICRD
jgi:hypothetical protein